MDPKLPKILFAEDEEDIRDIVSMALEMAGIEAIACASGDELLEKAAGFQADLILLDVMMPGRDGPQTLMELRKNPGTSKLPIVFMTAKVQKKEVDYYHEIGAAEVLAKPFDPMALPDRLREIWNRCRRT